MLSLYRILRPLLFRLDPETAHTLVFRILRTSQSILERRPPKPFVTAQRRTLFGLDFPNAIGLAAGLDKNAELPHVWAALGFGFAEFGTVTARAQPGNPRPRIFRLPLDQALINRLGFNNNGAHAVAHRLAQRFARSRSPIPIGINIGKSKIIPVEDALGDYLTSFRALAPLADYVTINVSSPNTPGLRDLQDEARLNPLLSGLQEENHRLARGRPPRPLLLKIAPDLPIDQLAGIVDAARRNQLSAIIATNTTIQRPNLRSRPALTSQAGGLSGRPLRPIANHLIEHLKELCGSELPIIGVGGIFNAADFSETMELGARLVQLYTGLIYEGPGIVRAMAGKSLSVS